MEIEPNKSKALVVDLLMHFFKVLTKALLGPFFINEIDQSAILVVLLNIFVVLFRHLQVQLVIAVNADFGAPFQIGVLVPEKWHWASQLHMRKYIFFTAVLG